VKDSLARLESEVERLTRRLQDLEDRMLSLEKRTAAQGAGDKISVTAESAETGLPAAGSAAATDRTGVLSLAGRFFIVMGGAYLLRALTEANTLTPVLGVLSGLGYALFWTVAAGRAAARGQRWNGGFHGVAAAFIAFPLVYEAAIRFRILPSPVDSWLLGGMTASMLLVAYLSRFRVLAWMATVGALITAAALLAESQSFVPCAVFLIFLGVANLWLGYELEWIGLRWPVALAADLVVLGLTLRALARDPLEPPPAALTVQLLLLGLYLASVAFRTLVRARNVIPFEVVQIIAAFLLGFVGAVYTTRATGFGTVFLGAAGLLLGFACYAVAFAFVGRREGRGRNFYFYTSLALLFTLTGSGLLMRGAELGISWTLFAALMAILGWRFSRLALTLHATISVVACCFATGMFQFIAGALVGSAERMAGIPVAMAPVALLGAAVCLALPLPPHFDVPFVFCRVQRLVMIVVMVGGIGGMLIAAFAMLWGGLPQGGVDPGILATVRSIVLSLSAVLLAWMGRRERFLEWGWLVYPLLAATGIKILFEDLSRSRPATLFLALILFGGALILSPRLRRSAEPSIGPDSPAE
jgi:hypothetical protein